MFNFIIDGIWGSLNKHYNTNVENKNNMQNK